MNSPTLGNNPERPPDMTFVPEVFDAMDGAETPFGRRYGGDVFSLTPEMLASLESGKVLALDVQNEYVVFLKSAGRRDGENREELNYVE
jgi:hypothetical protein